MKSATPHAGSCKNQPTTLRRHDASAACDAHSVAMQPGLLRPTWECGVHTNDGLGARSKQRETSSAEPKNVQHKP